MSNKKRNCQQQNYQCGGTCIQGVEVCHVDGLTQNAQKLADKVVGTINLTRPEGYKKNRNSSGIDLTRPKNYKLNQKPQEQIKDIIDLIDLTRPEGYKKPKSNLDLRNDTDPQRVINNGKKLVSQFIDEKSLEAYEKEREESLKNRDNNFNQAEQIMEDISDIDWDIDILESNSFFEDLSEEQTEELKNLRDKKTKLENKYKTLIEEPKRKSITDEDSEKFQNLLNNLSGNFNENDIEIDDTVGEKRVEKVKKNAGDAFSLLGLDTKIKFLEIEPRAFAEDGVPFSATNKVHRISQTKGIEEGKKRFVEEYKKAKSGKINIGSDRDPEEDRETIFHEIGHHLEFSNSSIGDIHTNFIENRSSTKEIKTIAELTGNNSYDQSEKAYEGNYIDPYVGKIYDTDTYKPVKTTESFSVGFQHFSSPDKMLELYNKDKEYFYLIVGTIVEAKKG